MLRRRTLTLLTVSLLLGASGCGAAGGLAPPRPAPLCPEEEGLPRCQRDDAPHRNLHAFWRTFDERYAVFDVRLPGGDWSALGRAACERLGDGADDEALYEVLLDLARNLDDGHVGLEAPDLGREDDAWVSVYPHQDAAEGLELNAEERYLSEELSWAANDWFAWGWIGDVGYLSLTSLDDLSASGSAEADRQAAKRAMTAVLADLGQARAMIVDVRANGGGWDEVALVIPTFFAGQRRLVWSKRTRDGPAHDDFGPWEDVYVDGARPGAFAGPVVLLTCGGTFSAAETFALAMRARDRVTLLGEPTSGHFSDLCDGELPCGWTFTYSGERYRAADGELYEARGVPVDQAVDLDVAALASGRDVMLEAALAALSDGGD
jgi:carboxyl-terminal processing protease